jgi:hypothetical protein
VFRIANAGYACAMAQVSPVALAPATTTAALHPGDYYRTERDLYRIEELHGDFALIEDCRSEIVLDVAVSEILTMDRVRPSAG